MTSLVERQDGGEDARLVGNIDDSLEAIEEILGALLDISRLDSGAMTPSISSFRMSDLMRSLEVEFAPIAKARKLDLTFVPCSLPVTSDRVLLRRLLQNLISNAIKYTPKGRVLIGCRRKGKSLEIGIYDTGLGIPVLKRAEIFKEFHPPRSGRADRARARTRTVDRGAARACAESRHCGGLEPQRRFALFRDHADRQDRHTDRRADGHQHLVESADERHTHRLHRERPRHPRRHEDAADRLGCQSDRGPPIRPPRRKPSPPPASASRDFWWTIIWIVATAIAAIRDIRQRFGENIPAILITADRSPHVRDAAREDGIVVLNKPVKPAALRALLGQWRTQQMVAAE